MQKFKTKLCSLLTATALVGSCLPATVVNAATTPKINKSSISLYVGQTTSLKVSGVNKIKWSSPNTKIATVSTKGKVTAKKKGNVTIKGVANSKTYTCKVSVKNCKLTATKATLELGKAKQLKLTGATANKVKWSTSNSKVATVKNGKIQTVAVGSATIKATYMKQTYKCTVTVAHTKHTFESTYKETRYDNHDSLCSKIVKTETCKYCKKSQSDVSYIKHDLAEKSSVAATCEENGKIIYECKNKNCNYNKEVIVNALGHDYVKTDEKSATCTNKGSITYKCNNCGQEKIDTIDMISHDYDKTITNPTCTEDGLEELLCKKCGDYQSEVIPAYGHKYSEEVIKAVTCTEDGTIKKTCVRCKTETLATIKTSGHTFTETTNQATCDTPSYITKKCEYCDYSEVTELSPALGHNYIENIDKHVDPTCKSVGSSVLVCSKCGQETKKSLPIIAHDYKEISVTKEPTCTTPGVRKVECTMCHSTKTETIPALTHDYISSSTEAATCEADGSRVYTCSRCGYEKNEKIDALGHDYAVIESASATCTEDGYIKSKCSNCNDIKNETIPALGHAYEQIERKDATCAEEGCIKSQCSVCQYIQNSPIAKLEHDLYDKEITAATCEAPEKKIIACRKCNYETSKPTGTPALGHTYETIGTEAANCAHGTGTIKKCSTCKKEIVEYSDDVSTDNNIHVYTLTDIGNSTYQYVCKNCGIADAKHSDKYTAEYPCMGKVYTVAATNTDALSNTYIKVAESDITSLLSPYSITVVSTNGTKVKVFFKLVENKAYTDGYAVKIYTQKGSDDPTSFEVINGESSTGTVLYLPKVYDNGSTQKIWLVSLARLTTGYLYGFYTESVESFEIQYTHLLIKQAN